MEQNPYSPPRADVVEAGGGPEHVPTRYLDGPSGIGGWLVLPLLGLMLTPVQVGIQTVRDFPPVLGTQVWGQLTTPGGESYHPLWAQLIIFELVTNVVVIGFSLVLLVLFFRKSRRVPSLMIGWMLLNFAIQVIDLVLVGAIPAAASAAGAQDRTDLSRAVVGAAVWIPYFLRSKRVRNTFVE